MRTLLYTAMCALVIGSQAFLSAPDVYSQEFGADLSGVIYDQPIYYAVDHDNLINPRNDILDLPAYTNKSWGKMNLNLTYNDFRFITQTRPTLLLQDHASPKFDFFTDDAYIDWHLSKQNFLYLGRRNLVEGIGYGAQPTDFLGEAKKTDYTLREEERRVQREGNYLVGGDAFLKNITLTAVYAPKIHHWQQVKDRVLLKGKLLVESINTDMAMHLFYGDIPGVGFGLSSTVSNNLVLYTESAVRWGSNKMKITIVSEETATTPRKFNIRHPYDKNKLYPNIVVGGNYTFGDGTNIIAEYIYNGAGYSGREWKEFTGFVKYNNNAFEDNSFTDSATANLVRASSIMNIRKMRKNYAFFRISNSKLIENVDGQLVFMVNADDPSCLGYLSIDYKVTKNFVAGLYSTIYAGKKDSEFGMQYWPGEFGLVLRYYFNVPNLLKSEKKST